MANRPNTTSQRRVTTSVPALLCVYNPCLRPDIEAASERVVLGIEVVAAAAKRMLAAGRSCIQGRFWATLLVRDAVVLVAARRYPGCVPLPVSLVRIGLDEAAAVTSESWMADAAVRLGPPS